MGFGFPTMGSPMLGDPDAPSYSANPSPFLHRIAPFSLDTIAIFSLFSLELPTLFFFVFKNFVLLFIA